MTVIRSFIALEIPEPVRKQMGLVVARLQPHIPPGSVRWVGLTNMHLTLVFLGDVSVTSLAQLSLELKAESAQHAPLEFTVGGLGAFPTASRPRVIWAGIEAPPELLSLQAGIQARLDRLGYPSEEREYSPHLTLGRVSKSASPVAVRQVGQAVQAETVGLLGAVSAAEVLLVRSDLQSGGPVYTMLDRVPLGGPR